MPVNEDIDCICSDCKEPMVVKAETGNWTRAFMGLPVRCLKCWDKISEEVMKRRAAEKAG
jgi:hypothetical protein